MYAPRVHDTARVSTTSTTAKSVAAGGRDAISKSRRTPSHTGSSNLPRRPVGFAKSSKTASAAAPAGARNHAAASSTSDAIAGFRALREEMCSGPRANETPWVTARTAAQIAAASPILLSARRTRARPSFTRSSDSAGLNGDRDVAANRVRDRAPLLRARGQLLQLALVDPFEPFDARGELRRDDLDAGVALVSRYRGGDAQLRGLAPLLADRVGKHHRVADRVRRGEHLLGRRLAVALLGDAARKGDRHRKGAGPGSGAAGAMKQIAGPVHVRVS